MLGPQRTWATLETTTILRSWRILFRTCFSIVETNAVSSAFSSALTIGHPPYGVPRLHFAIAYLRTVPTLPKSFHPPFILTAEFPSSILAIARQSEKQLSAQTLPRTKRSAHLYRLKRDVSNRFLHLFVPSVPSSND